MTKTIDTLVPDIYQVLRNSRLGKGIELTVEQQAELGAALAAKTARALNREDRARPAKTLYMSEIGKPCLRQLWYSVYRPEIGEKLLPHTQFKFLNGDYLEEVVLFLAKVAGHKVEGEQELHELTCNGWTIRGRQDALIDGVLVDVKSASTYSFKKFEEGLNDSNDSFGYRIQLEGYAVKHSYPHMGWVVIDKQNGHIQWAPHLHGNWVGVEKRLNAVTKALNWSVPPVRKFDLVPDGKSGNERLGIECSYCPYKMECWKDSNGGYGLRAFNYGRGPVFLGTIEREPKVPEIPLTEADSEPESLESANEGTTA